MCITLGTLGAGKGRRKKKYFAMRNSEQWSLGYLLCRTHFSIQSQICPKGRISFNGYGSSMGRGVRGSTLDMMLRIAAHLVAWRLSQDHESLRPSTNHHWLSRMIIDHHGSLLIVTNHHSLQLITSRTVVMTVLGMRTQPCEGKGTTGPEESLSGSKIMVPCTLVNTENVHPKGLCLTHPHVPWFGFSEWCQDPSVKTSNES